MPQGVVTALMLLFWKVLGTQKLFAVYSFSHSKSLIAELLDASGYVMYQRNIITWVAVFFKCVMIWLLAIGLSWKNFWAVATVGCIARHNASIAGAEVGCREEGVASAMA